MTAKTFFNAAIAATCRHFASFCNTASAASAFTSVTNLLNYHILNCLPRTEVYVAARCRIRSSLLLMTVIKFKNVDDTLDAYAFVSILIPRRAIICRVAGRHNKLERIFRIFYSLEEMLLYIST